MANHAEFLALAEELIEEDGRTVIFQTLSAGPADSNKPWKGAGATPVPATLATAKAVFLPRKGLDFGTDFVGEEFLKLCTEVCLVAGSAGDLEDCNVVNDSNKRFNVVWVSRLKPADLTLLYALGITR